MSTRILLVEDDVRLSALVAEYLRKHEYDVDTVLDGALAVQTIVSRRPDLVILDVNLPGKDGFQICREARQHYDGIVIMVTARDEEFDEVLGLELGADDYVHKPVQPRVLLAHIKAQLRRTVQRQSPVVQPDAITLGRFTIDRESRTVTLPNGRTPELTSAEFDLLWALARSAGKVVTRDELLKELRGFEFDGLDRSIDAGIYKLRRKLNDDTAAPHRILTVRGKGYQLNKSGWD
ncbi:response regulator [Pandoraea pulmonicola]|uniref:DNA-binding response regulator n=1 Tax=Pandoraea pulmonicola TaxID=93221 RepID=A0AAJ4ZBS3_PANPU|nr:response regulator [Pandoraea pulmonicola]AJC21042.1 DNA-binding response regulator [Pandoraea pulmonicola]SUA90316.1 Transcriptional regulatory protein RstA [Pandoraea pulmonicola]